MGNLFSELRRRNIFRVAGVYAVVGWLLIQMGIALETSLDMPSWFDKLITILVLIGFPVAMIMAWAFEMTPEGVKRTESVNAEDSITDKTGRRLDFAILGGLALVAGLAVFQISRPDTPSTTNDAATLQQDGAEEGKSIAVLPFVNMSSDKEQEYFADGISEEILNVLVRIPDLKVAGRTSSFSFKNKNEDLRIIGEALNVNHILEGSVRRSGAKLRITAQLIRSDDGFHLWSDTYDREVADIFDIQDEIAKEVAEQLAISLGLNPRTNVHERTDDLVAFENYLKAKQLFLERGRENLDAALVLLDDATERDPDFAPAWTTTALVYGVYASYASEKEQIENRKQWYSKGRNAAQRALTLNPDSAEANAALGTFHFYDFEFIKAYEFYDRAREFGSENPIVLDKLAQAGMKVGYFDDAQKLSERAIALDPLVAMYKNVQGGTLSAIDEHEKAIENFEQSIALDPNLIFSYQNLEWSYIEANELGKYENLVRRAFESGVYTPEWLEFYQPIMDLVADKALMADEKALRDLTGQTPNIDIEYFLISYLGDGEAMVEFLEKHDWNEAYRSDPDLFNTGITNIYANERWKQQVRKDGILALWQSRGFPAHCKPIGDDDFECE